MSYEEAMRFWYARVNYEQRVPQPAELKLDHMKSLLARLGDPHRRLRIVHVAGSKGKGSTSAMLAEILAAAGYRTGLFTSPHLCEVEERLRINGAPIGQAELAALMTDVARAALAQHESEAEPTFFEIAAALCFLHFLRRRVDVAVLEVGLGGRFDSTNVCSPEVALITSISFDHVRQLGNRLDSIAREKAGIIKTGRPVISGVLAPEARTVIENTAQTRHAPLQQLGADFHYRYEPGNAAQARKAKIQICTASRNWPEMELGLLGEHQAANASVVVACVEKLQSLGWHISDQAVARGLAEVAWPARLEIMCRTPWVILDCAHNVASALALVETLATSFPPCRRSLIFASSRDKDVAGMFRTFQSHFDRAHLTRFGSNPRSFTPAELALLWGASNEAPCALHESAPRALESALREAKPEDLICITGSVFLAGELRPLIAKLAVSSDFRKSPLIQW
jgi:dihydrofolate synthase/folylpolyglutamate synthase